MKKTLLHCLLFYFIFQISWAQTDNLEIENEPIETITQDTTQISNVSLPDTIVYKRTLPQHFKNKYSDSDFVYETEVAEKNWWNRLKEKMASFFENLFDLSSSEEAEEWVDWILKGLAVTIIIVVIYLIVKSILNKEGQWIFGKSSDKRLLKIEDIEKNLHLIDFEKLIQETIQKGESRLAIRYYYLWLLKKMTEKNIIVWDLEKTNSDYVREIQSAALKEKFIYLSYIYNNIWYGAFEIDNATFERMKTDFITTLKTI